MSRRQGCVLHYNLINEKQIINKIKKTTIGERRGNETLSTLENSQNDNNKRGPEQFRMGMRNYFEQKSNLNLISKTKPFS
jgi:hypothetical protein